MSVTRRALLQRMGLLTVASTLARPLLGQSGPRAASGVQPSPWPDQLTGTEPLTLEGDPAAQMVEGIRKFLLELTAQSVAKREVLWPRDFSSAKAYATSVAGNRARFAKAIGLLDARVEYETPEVVHELGDPDATAEGRLFRAYAVRWPVLPGVDAEGLLLQPWGTPVARVVAIPDADWTPEMLTGLSVGLPAEAQYARRLAENGCQVLVPTIIDRNDTWSGNPGLNVSTNLTHREFIYRMAYEMGRHIIGYEVQKVLAAVDWFARSKPHLQVGVIGCGEGGLLALYSAAADSRVDATVVSGYFQSRQELWNEPVYRNVWTLLQEFGDAEIASLIAPRGLVVEACRAPESEGPPKPAVGQLDTAAPGSVVTPKLESVQPEVERTKPVFGRLAAEERLELVVSGGNGQGQPGSESALRKFLTMLGVNRELIGLGEKTVDERQNFDAAERMHRQFEQLIEFTQTTILESDKVRQRFWAKADDSSVGKWEETSEPYRQYLWEEILGKLPEPALPISAKTRIIYKEVNWTGYEVVLPLCREVFAYGILLVPNSLAAGERRPVVVCQHGLENRPQDLIKATVENEHYYHETAAELANHGFIVYCPQNPYRGGVKFRQLQRLANPLKLSIFSFILAQHKRTLEWLAQQPFVDSKRIGFYGLSYGGKTALRVPPLLDGYCLSICSGDFNEWIWKVSRYDERFSYVYTYEYEMPEFSLGNYFNHSDMANLMAPRPFMVERGHSDGIGPDSWAAYEYANVKRHYDRLNLPERTRIEYFNGPHTMHAVGAVEFLHRYLQWGEPYEY